MSIHFTSEHTAMPQIDEQRVSLWLQAVAASYYKRIGRLQYIFTSDEHILDINREFLSHDYYTDVITFDYSFGDVLSGDIFISVDTVKSNSQMLSTDFQTELHRIIVHGLLHLTGQGDKTPESKQEMTKKEDAALSILATSF